MKKLLPFSFLILSNLFSLTALGQLKAVPGQVAAILVHNAAGGLNGSESVDIKVVPEVGSWNSYLVRKTKHGLQLQGKPYDSVMHRFIATLNPLLVAKLLNAITAIKPSITGSTFGLTAPGLIDELKNGAKKPVTNAPDFNKLITQKLVDDIIAKTVVDLTVMDDNEYSEVKIVTRHNDTIKLSTRRLCPTKLPWTIGRRLTYNMDINNFVLAAIGNQDVPNKQALQIGSLKESIYKYIDEQHTNAPIAGFKWKYYYPEKLKLLAERFKIIGTRFLSGNVYYCRLKTSTMPASAVLESTMDMTHDEDIRTTLRYAELIDQYFKTDNFVLKYFGSRPDASINFSYATGRSPYHPLLYLGKKLPELAKADSAKTICFWASTPDDSSYWILFPDQQSLLTYHAVTTADGKAAPIYPPQNADDSWSTKTNTYYLFDNAGKVLSQGLGF